MLKLLIKLFDLVPLVIKVFNFLDFNQIKLLHFPIFGIKVSYDDLILILQVLYLIFKLFVFIGESFNDDILISSEGGRHSCSLRNLIVKLLNILLKILLG